GDGDDGGRGARRRHLAFVTALARHPPSLRVFRLASEVSFVLLCAGVALRAWEAVGRDGDGDEGDEQGGRGCGRGGVADDGKLEVGSEDWRDDVAGDRRRRGTDDGGARIAPEKVGELLFAPPPDAATAGDLRRGRRRRYAPLRRRGRRRDGNNDDDDDNNKDNDSSNDNEIGRANGESADGLNDDDGDDDVFCEEAGDIYPQIPPPPLPPPSSSVLGAALDSFTVTCAFLILFTVSSAEGGRYIDDRSKLSWTGSWMKHVAKVAAPAFPLALFLLGASAAIVPWRKRKDGWIVLSTTVGAPLFPVTFRDGFVGDVLTSAVRPLQDLAFTAFFVPLGLRAWWSDGYSMDDVERAGVPLERSWILHTTVLPACTLSPLWWRFLQNLRQCRDARRRWPHLGNALKYLLAAGVASFGLFDPGARGRAPWRTCFLLATLYQVWWDVAMDWGLLERDPAFQGRDGRGIASRRWPWRLRSRRLYRRRWAYGAIFVVNFCLRFAGMLTLIPPVYLSRATGMIVDPRRDGPELRLFAGSLLACAEIFRRAIWALLRLEWEVVRRESNGDGREEGGQPLELGPSKLVEEGCMRPMSIATSGSIGRTWPRRRAFWPLAFTRESFSAESLSDMSNLDDIQILSELCVWATVFSGIAIVAAAHRAVL
ncbi:hypothetical protein ACHAWF_012932, partial [Thalassiosira exigua]